MLINIMSSALTPEVAQDTLKAPARPPLSAGAN